MFSGDHVALSAGCEFEPEGTKRTDVFARRLDRSCTPTDRERLAIQASEILGALAEGKGIDLASVVIQGDLDLENLPLRSTSELKPLRQALPDVLNGVASVRVVARPLILRDSVVRGRLATNDVNGTLVVQGPLTVTGTTFEQVVDLSRVVFAGSVDFSASTFKGEALFVQSRFTQPVRFVNTVFGSRARFHRARFDQPTSLRQARFNGFAELLEVQFEKEVDLSGATFGSGTGFSGSRFCGRADLSKTRFEREAYFLFAEFNGPVSFAEATFGFSVDFSDAKFQQDTSFSQTHFEQRPQFDRTAFPAGQAPPWGSSSPASQLAITLTFLILSVLLVVYLVRLK
jgi:hypothetical protein